MRLALAAVLLLAVTGSSSGGIGSTLLPVQLAWSADSRELAVGLSYSNELPIFDAEGDLLRTLSPAPKHEIVRDPQWSPSANAIAVTRTLRDGTYTVDVVSADGSSERTVAVGRGPSWSPDGKLIAYNDASLQHVWVVAAGGSDAQMIGDGYRPTWRPDGSRIAVSRIDGVWTMRPDGSGAVHVGSGIPPLLWSPDGTRLAFYDASTSRAIVARADGTTVAMPSRSSPIAWSPDGAHLAVASASDEDRTLAVDVKTGATSRLSDERFVPAPDWHLGATVITAGRGRAVYLVAPGDLRPHRLALTQCASYSAPCTEGGDGPDRLRGTASRDVIFPGAGSDLVLAGGGPDRIDGAFGDDVVYGGAGNDVILGQGGADRIYGGPGMDILQGGPGRDTMDGGDGDDFVPSWGDGGADTIRCGGGHDEVVADRLDRIARDCEAVIRIP